MHTQRCLLFPFGDAGQHLVQWLHGRQRRRPRLRLAHEALAELPPGLVAQREVRPGEPRHDGGAQLAVQALAHPLDGGGGPDVCRRCRLPLILAQRLHFPSQRQRIVHGLHRLQRSTSRPRAHPHDVALRQFPVHVRAVRGTAQLRRHVQTQAELGEGLGVQCRVRLGLGLQMFRERLAEHCGLLLGLRLLRLGPHDAHALGTQRGGLLEIADPGASHGLTAEVLLLDERHLAEGPVLGKLGSCGLRAKALELADPGVKAGPLSCHGGSSGQQRSHGQLLLARQHCGFAR
mmetsp:Transcript_5173/g.12213  ORF Transcript_5173/g.12213 Transcript_5173/m.12213 type:complete len:290 (-) Transcript_5173:174-1043(-)